MLRECGFDLTFTTWRNWLFESRLRASSTAGDFGENIDNPIKVEVHTHIRERLPISETDITQFSVSARGATPAQRLSVGCVAHDASSAARGREHACHALRLIQLHDIALLASGFNAATGMSC